MNLLRANRLSAGGRALRPWLWRTLRPAAALGPSGQASPAERQPCRTAGARFTAARALGRGRRRAWSAAGEQTGKHGRFSREAKAERSRVRAAILAVRNLRDSI